MLKKKRELSCIWMTASKGLVISGVTTSRYSNGDTNVTASRSRMEASTGLIGTSWGG